MLKSPGATGVSPVLRWIVRPDRLCRHRIAQRKAPPLIGLTCWAVVLLVSLGTHAGPPRTGAGSQAAGADDGALIATEDADGRFPLVRDGQAADVYVDADDFAVARIAASHLVDDLQRVTGCQGRLLHATKQLSSRAVLIGTLGKSPLLDRIARSDAFDVSDVRGRWETCAIGVVTNPLPGMEEAFVIAGSDRRGTAYGVYEVSRRIGVSPWYWWADVSPKRRDALYVNPTRVRVGPPAVKYRGIFINDEMWGIRHWAEGNFAPEEGRGLGPKTHRRIFELLLRLRANYLWPAMHRHTIPFNYYPENKVVADEYAIVMGSSHIEPMLRNNMHGAEWDQEDGTAWNYRTNRQAIHDYWERRVKANGQYENIYTIGMRGKDDEAMYAGGSVDDRIRLLERIFADQREILAQHVDPDVTKVPQVFIPYTEVLGLYNRGLKVPEDAIICWPDDNFGYIRRLPTRKERARAGGSGVYYHIQWLNGATTAYTWLNTMPPALIWEEMQKAYQHDARSLWVLNVGDIKPGEVSMEFFLDMAWQPERWRRDNIHEFLVEWAARDLDSRFAEDIADVMQKHFQLGYTRRPEHLVQYSGRHGWQYSWFSHEHHGDEAQRRLDAYEKIARQARSIFEKLPRERKDAFFQLVLYPVECAYQMNRKVISADRSMSYAGQGRTSAGEYAARARDAERQIIQLTDHYNRGLITVGDKWNYMMTWAPGPWGRQRHQFEMPPLSSFAGNGPPRLGVSLEGGRPNILADLSVYTRRKRFIDLFNHGKGPIDWTITTSEPWIILSQSRGRFETEQRVWIDVKWDRAPTGDGADASLIIKGAGDRREVVVPIFNPASPRRDEVTGFVESHGCVSMEAEHFSRKADQPDARWAVVEGLGRSGDSVTVFPADAATRGGAEQIRQRSPRLEYDMHIFHTGEATIHVDCLPTQPVGPEGGVRLAISLDENQPRLLSTTTRQSVLSNVRRWTGKLDVDSPGSHTLKVWMVDPGVVVDKIILCTQPIGESYLGPRESYRGGPD